VIVMTKYNQDFKIQEGDDIIIEDEVTKSDGTARDLSGHSVKFVLAKNSGATPEVTYTDSDSAVSITDAANGLLEVELASADTDGLAEYDPAELYYEIEVTNQSNEDYTVTVGTITIEPSY